MTRIIKLKNKKTGRVVTLAKKPPFRPRDRAAGNKYAGKKSTKGYA